MSFSSPAAPPASAPTSSRAFARNRARVAFIDLQREAGEALARGARRARATKPLFIDCDVTDIRPCKRAIATTRERLGPIGVLVNNAANDERQAFDEVTAEFWDEMQNVNLRHHFFAAQAVQPQMRSSAAARSSTCPRSPGARAPARCRPMRRPRPASSASRVRWPAPSAPTIFASTRSSRAR